MKWLSALVLGAILAFVLPLVFGGQGGVWMNSWTKWGTIRPHRGVAGLPVLDPAVPGLGTGLSAVLQLAQALSARMPDRVPVIRVTAMPADTNPYGGVFGGWLMGQMGLACGSFASRHTRRQGGGGRGGHI